MPRHVHQYLSLEQLKRKQQQSVSRQFLILAPSLVTLPCSTSLKSQVLEVYDQGHEGSCTANAFCAAYRMLNPDKTFNPSRQYVYWKTRLVEDGNNPIAISDSGANVEDTVNYVTEHGVCSETLWPYTPTTVDTEPPASCDIDAANHKLGKLKTIQLGNANLIKQILLNGTPVLIAFGVYSSFESWLTSKTGIAIMPHPIKYEDKNDPSDSFKGGHETLIVGYHDFPGYFTCLNSWGTGWGASGYFYLPYSFVTDSRITYQLCCLTL